MLLLFDVLKDKLKPKLNSICIDNWIFKLHYRVTFIIFGVAAILVTSREYIGEHIKCITDMKDPGFERVVETFCFFTSTFTVVEKKNYDMFSYGQFGHPGISSYGIGSKKPIRHHLYYQWVPFILFGQAIMFYLTHLLWKKLEDNRIEKLVAGMNVSTFALLEKEQNLDDKKEDCIRKIKEAFFKRVSINKSWAQLYIICEILNVVNVVFQFYMTDRFLGRQFSNLGPRLITNGSSVLDEVFPKITKCSFHKYGPSGSIQVHDVLCVMALNVVNEKIYTFLWFWFVILFVASCLVLVWRLLTIFLYNRCTIFNQFVFGHTLQSKLYPWHIKMVIKHYSYCEWLFLKYLSKNMNSLAFRQLFINISEEVEEKKPLFMSPQKHRVNFDVMNKFE